MSVFALVCRKHSGQDRFMIGTALANRPSHLYQSTLGMFVNTVPVPVYLPGDKTFASFANDVMRNVHFAILHGAVPLAEIVKELPSMQRARGEAPFNVAFSFHDSLPLQPKFHALDVVVDEGLAKATLNKPWPKSTLLR